MAVSIKGFTYEGLSTDAKPTTNVPTNSRFLETDKGTEYRWNGTNWVVAFDAATIGSGRFPLARLPGGTSGLVLTAQGANQDPAWSNPYVYTTFVLGDSSDPLTTGTDKNPIPVEATATLTILEVRLKVKTAPTGAAIIVDVNKNGTTIFTTQANRPQIAAAATEGQSTTIDVSGLVKGDDLTFDIDQVGSTTAGSQLMVEIICKQYLSV